MVAIGGHAQAGDTLSRVLCSRSMAMMRLALWVLKPRAGSSFALCLSLAASVTAQSTGVPPPLRALAETMPRREVDILLNVGREYELDGEALKLLLVIRKIENGASGIEMGVGANRPRHPARRYANDPDRSVRIQAQWAAGTIQKRYSGDLDAFAKRYCPPRWTHWSGMARSWMEKP